MAPSPFEEKDFSADSSPRGVAAVRDRIRPGREMWLGAAGAGSACGNWTTGVTCRSCRSAFSCDCIIRNSGIRSVSRGNSGIRGAARGVRQEQSVRT